MAIAMKTPPPLSTLRPDAPAGLEQAILKCLEKDREKRYRNVAELGRALVEFGPAQGRISLPENFGHSRALGPLDAAPFDATFGACSVRPGARRGFDPGLLGAHISAKAGHEKEARDVGRRRGDSAHCLFVGEKACAAIANE